MLSRKNLTCPLLLLHKSLFFCVKFILTKQQFKLLHCLTHCKSGWVCLLECMKCKMLASPLLFELCWFLFLCHFICAFSEDLGNNRTEIEGPVLSQHLCYSYPSFHSSLIHMHIQCAADNQRFWADTVLRSAGRCRLLPLCCLLTAAWWKWGWW